jgi:hypothetical protein
LSKGIWSLPYPFNCLMTAALLASSRVGPTDIKVGGAATLEATKKAKSQSIRWIENQETRVSGNHKIRRKEDHNNDGEMRR